MNTQTQCCKYFQVRPPQGSAESETTDERYCSWDRLFGGYGYIRAWVEKLVRDLSDAETYEEFVGVPPTHR